MVFKMEKKKKAKFVRTDFRKYSKLGVRRKKKQIYRKARGRDNKIRLNMKGHTTNVRIGYANAREGKGLIDGLKPVMVYNIEDLEKVGAGMIGIVGKVGGKKRKEIAEEVLKSEVKLKNLNAKKFLDEIEEKIKKIKSESKDREKKKEKREKEAEKKVKEEAKEGEKKDKNDEEIGEKVKEEKVEKKEDKTKNEIKEKKVEAKKEVPQTNNYGRGK